MHMQGIQSPSGTLDNRFHNEITSLNSMAIYPKCDHTLYGVFITKTKTLSNTFALISIEFCFSLSSFPS